jgi:acyl-CoA synthetase (NDP forming)
MSCSGGEASLIADSVLDFELNFRPLASQEAQRVRDTLSDLVSVTNPLDYHTFIWDNESALSNTYTTMIANRFDLNYLVCDFPRADRCSDHSWQASIAAIKHAAKHTGERVAVVSTLGENLPERYAADFMAAGIAPLSGMNEALAATAAAADIGEAWASPAPTLWPATPTLNSSEINLLDEHAAKRLLADYGIRTPLGHIVTSSADAVTRAHALAVPVVIKAIGVAHKTDADAVRLRLTSDAQINQAADELLAQANQILVEEMIDDAVVELIVGVHRDPVYGYLLTLGAGGVLVELLDDKLTLRMPVSEETLRAALNTLRIGKLLTGYRNQPPADVQAIVDCALNLQRFTEDHRGELLEVDINPLLVRAEVEGAVAADALIRLVQKNPHLNPTTAHQTLSV